MREAYQQNRGVRSCQNLSRPLAVEPRKMPKLMLVIELMPLGPLPSM